MRRLVYIAGPYAGQGTDAAARKAQEAINVNRACFVGHVLWKRRNYAPIVPHAIGTMVYGDDHNPEIRQMSITAGEAQARATALAGGSFFALRRDDCTLSEGTGREMHAFEETYNARVLLGLEDVGIDWHTLLAATAEPWGVHVRDEKSHVHHIVWIGTFARFLDLFTTRDDVVRWESSRGWLGNKGDR